MRKLDAKLEAEADCLGADSDASEAAEGRRPGASRTGTDSADADANGRGPGESGNEAEFPWLQSSEEREAEKSPPIRDVADMPCLFTDTGHMSEKTAPCCWHGSKCNVPSVDLLLVGTSCKDLSKANPNKSQDRQRATFSLMHSRGGSAQTFRGLMGYLKNRRLSFVVFENVDTLDKSSQSGASNQHILMDEMAQLGYEGQPTILRGVQIWTGLPAQAMLHFLCASHSEHPCGLRSPRCPVLLPALPRISGQLYARRAFIGNSSSCRQQ